MVQKKRFFSFTKSLDDRFLGSLEIRASGTISAYHPATMYERNGDPGSPAEGGEVSFEELLVTDSEGNEVEGYEPDREILEEEAFENAY